jgi:hypothetical protein
MKNVTPLQLKAQQLREESKRAEQETQQQLQDHLANEQRELINKFSSSFSSLYSLLIGSNVGIRAEISSVDKVILLSLDGNKVIIGFEQTAYDIISWTILNNSFKATIPSKELGVIANRKDEDRLIIAIEELLFTPRAAVNEDETETNLISSPASMG